LRVFLRGFSTGKSEAVNLQRPLIKPKTKQLFLSVVAHSTYLL